MEKLKLSEVTPESLYVNRRTFLKAMGVISASAFLNACQLRTGARTVEEAAKLPGTSSYGENSTPAPQPKKTGNRPTDELGDIATPIDVIKNYNNFYEFTLIKQEVARLAKDFVSRPWTISVGGLVNNPKTYDVDELIKRYGEEERVYRLRCVEGWSIVIPWLGFPLRKLLLDVEPKAGAAFVRFETLYDPGQFPNLINPWYDWPYVEGLRLDEAMNDLTILSTGLYGKSLPPQNGAPIRLVVPWKYGFKSIKSIVKIDLVEFMPISFWMKAAPNEYGFYSNVNPEVAHPRWSQSTERRIGEIQRRKTLPFNGYAEQVADMYAGMDLSEPNERAEIGTWGGNQK